MADQETIRAWYRPLKSSSENFPTHYKRQGTIYARELRSGKWTAFAAVANIFCRKAAQIALMHMKKYIARIIATGTFTFAGCCTMRQTKIWEYREAVSIDEVNQRAAQGWKVESFTATDSGSARYKYYLLKRAKRD
jgi:hypothetical protein